MEEKAVTTIYLYIDDEGRDRIRLVSSDGNHPIELQKAIDEYVGIVNSEDILYGTLTYIRDRLFEWLYRIKK